MDDNPIPDEPPVPPGAPIPEQPATPDDSPVLSCETVPPGTNLQDRTGEGANSGEGAGAGTGGVAGAGVAGSLRRSVDDRLVGGVAGGIARELRVPSWLVRIGFVLAACVGIGVPVYLLMWILVPDDRGERAMGRGPLQDLLLVGGAVVASLVVIGPLLGAIALVPFSWGGRSVLTGVVPWALIFVGAGLFLRRSEVGGVVPTDAAVMGGGGGREDGGNFGTGSVPVVSGPRPLSSGRPDMVRAPRAPRPLPFVGPITWAVALVVLGALGVLAITRPTATGPGVIGAALMLVFGAGLTISAFRGRARGLLLPALAIGSALVMLAGFDTRADNVARPFDVRVEDGAALRDSYIAAGGSAQLDLSGLRLDRSRTVHVTLTTGRLRIVLPANVRTTSVVHHGVGSIFMGSPSGRLTLSSLGGAVDSTISSFDERGVSELGQRWAKDGLPAAGTPLTHDEQVLLNTRSIAVAVHSVDADRSVTTGSGTSDAELRLVIDVGVADVALIEPRWSDLPAVLVEPEQLCTVGGGPRGVVEPCSTVPADSRVSLCINAAGNLVDCREDRPGTPDWPRTPACRDRLAGYVPCDSVGITAVGVERVSPGAEPVGPSFDGPSFDPNGGSAGGATTTFPSTTVNPVFPALTVPGTIAPATQSSASAPTIASTIAPAASSATNGG